MQSPPNIHVLLEQLNIDPRRFTWQDLADCRNLETEWFFDGYAGSRAVAIDSVCENCPVLKECHLAGVNGKETGVWGGFYLENGIASKKRNAHKTPEVVSRLANNIYD